MPQAKEHGNRLPQHRHQRGWTQAELARRAGISRAAVSAIESGRLSPSVTAALALARVLETTVERLFAPAVRELAPDWAWPATQASSRYWTAEVFGRTLAYPCEETAIGTMRHDGRVASRTDLTESSPNGETLVLAGCDPGAGLLVELLHRTTGVRVLPFVRSSRQALQLLGQRLVHVAGVHLSSPGEAGNAAVVARELGTGYRLLRLAEWEAGLTLAPATTATTVRSVVRSRLRWIGREPGSGARQCLDELFSNRREFRRIAYDHRGVAAAIRSGWADAGVCVRLVSEEAGQRFLSLRWESYDLVYPADQTDDPRWQALVNTVRSPEFRNVLAGLPGYDARHTGEVSST